MLILGRFESLCLMALLVVTEGSRFLRSLFLDLDETTESEDLARLLCAASLDLEETTELEDFARLLSSLDLDETIESDDFARLLWFTALLGLRTSERLLLWAASLLSALPFFSSGFEDLLLDLEASLP